MLETQLSPILGLILLGLVEFSTIIGAFASFSIAVVILLVNYLQLKQKIKVDSATLILKFLKPWHVNKGFTDLIDEINSSKIIKYDTEKLRMLLDHFEDIAVLWADKTLDETQILEYFGPNLRQIRDDKFIQQYIKTEKETALKIYENLLELIKKVR